MSEEVTFTRLAVRYVDRRRARGEITKATADQLRSRLLRFAAVVQVAPSRVTRRHVERWLEQPGLSPAYRYARLSALKGFCQWMVLEGHVRKDPTLGMKTPKLPDLAPRALTADQVDAVMTYAWPDLRLRLVLLLMLHQGLRRSEVAKLRIEDIDRSKRIMGIRGKGGQGRITDRLPIMDETWAALQSYLATVRTTTGPVVRSRKDPAKGIVGAHVGELVGRAMQEAGVKLHAWDGRSAHSFRHTCAQDLVDGGVEMRTTQRVLRHRSIRNTEWYVRGEVKGLREAMEGRSYRPGGATPAPALAPGGDVPAEVQR